MASAWTLSSRARWMLGATAVFVVLVWLLAPILTPFVIAAGLAYIGDPIVDRLEALKLPRTAGVSIVFVVLTLAGVLMLLLLLPMLREQFGSLIKRLPDALQTIQDQWLPALGIALPDGMSLDIESLREAIKENWSKAGGIAASLWGSISKSSLAALALVANLALIPVVTFYLLRDWDKMVARIAELIPRKYLPRVTDIAQETDEVLSAFIRGQLLVMFALALLYTTGLWIVGLELALLIGLLAGMVSFVPYLGMIIGIGAATIAMLVQTQAFLPVLGVWAVFGVGQVLESAVLTPLLVGDRIGLHPVAVIFAVLAGGQLFGFVGVLLALPAAAAIAVLLRVAVRIWLDSDAYQGQV